MTKIAYDFCNKIEYGEQNVAVATRTRCHLTEYITMWVTHHHCTKEGHKLTDNYRL